MVAATKNKLLVLDDDTDVCQTISGIAGLAGYQVRWTTLTQEFFEVVAAWQPDLILVDLAMPGMDGIDALRALAREGSSVKVIIISGLGTRVLEAAARAAQESGLDVAGVLAKPFSPLKLRGILGAASESAAQPGVPAHAAASSPLHVVTRAEFEKALQREQFVLHYQPKIDCSNGQLKGFEGLVRWHEPQRGLVLPDAFIPLAESTGLISALTVQLFGQALDWFGSSEWASQLSLALNISARTLVDPAFPDWMLQQCMQRGLAPQQIILEVTETASMQNPLMTLELLTQFRIRGFRLSIDDFGVGYSSLLQLARLPFSEMKIDKSFVTVARQSEEAQKIAIAIVGLAQALGLDVTAEGVEDQWTLDFLRDIGCSHAQGYLIGRPMPPADLGSWLQQWRERSGRA